jgi:hypothetical protein
MNKLDTRRMFVRKSAWSIIPIVLLIALAVVGCGSAGSPSAPTAAQPISTPTPMPTFVAPTPAYTVQVTKDVEYVTVLQPDAPVQTLDVYAPTEPGPWPVVVVMHGWKQSKEYPIYTSLGQDLAGRGVVVFVPQRRSESATLVDYAKDNGREIREVQESWACAVRFARETAADYGGDPGLLTVFAYDGAALDAAFIGDDLQQMWDEVASNRGGPPPQTECMAVEESAQVDRYIGYYGDYDFYERLSESDPDLWELTSPFALVGRNPSLQVYLIHGGMVAPTLIERAVALHEALANAGYDATQMLLGEAKWEIPWSGPDRETLIQTILEVARG